MVTRSAGRMESRTIILTSAARKHGNLNLSVCGKDFFPEDVYGGPSKKEQRGTPITVVFEGLPDPVDTDIPTEPPSRKSTNFIPSFH